MKLILIIIVLAALAMLGMTVFSRMMNRTGSDRKTLGAGVRLVAVPDAIAGRIVDLLASGQKIEAIKLLRETTGCGLVEAKDTIETLAR